MAGKRLVNSAEMQAHIKAKLKKSALNLYNDICNICGNNKVPDATVQNWARVNDRCLKDW
jgi:hypothetical protein